MNLGSATSGDPSTAPRRIESEKWGMTHVSLGEIIDMKVADAKKKESMRTRPKYWPWYILRPDARLSIATDLMTTLALICVYFVVPFELAFVESPFPPDPLDPLFIFNRMIDVAFWIEMVVNFARAFPRLLLDDDLVEEAYHMLEGESESTDVLASARSYEWRLSRIALNYAKGWLLMDIVSSVPSIFDIVGAASVSDMAAGAEAGADHRSSQVAMLRIGRTAKLGKFLKVMRILKIMRIAKLRKTMENGFVRDLFERITIALIEHTRKMRIAKILFLAFLVAHLLACILGMSTMFADQKLESWWGTNGFCWSGDIIGELPDGRDKARCVGEWEQCEYLRIRTRSPSLQPADESVFELNSRRLHVHALHASLHLRTGREPVLWERPRLRVLRIQR